MGDEKAGDALRDVYGSSTDRGEKKDVMEAFFLMDDYKGLIEIVKTEQDRELQKKALEYLSLLDSDEATDFVLGLLEG